MLLPIVLGVLGTLFVVYLIGSYAIAEVFCARWYEGQTATQTEELGPFLAAIDREAEQLCLVERALHRHQLHPSMGLLWFTSDRQILVHAWEGEIRGSLTTAKVKGLRILTRLTDGTYVETCNDFVAGTGGFCERRIRFGRLAQLLTTHRDWLGECRLAAQPFRGMTGAEAWDAFLHEEMQNSVSRGTVRCLDESRGLFRATLFGLLTQYGSFAAWVCRRCLGCSH